MANHSYVCPSCHHPSFSGERTPSGTYVLNCHNCGHVFATPLIAELIPQPTPDTPPPSTTIPQPQTTEAPPSRIRRLLNLTGNVIGNIIVVGIVLAFLILAYSYGTILDTGSMEPTLSGNDVVWENPFTDTFQRGDLVTFPNPQLAGETLFKRVIGLPTETVSISNGKVYINDKVLPEPWVPGFATSTIHAETTTLGPAEYYVLGDNRKYSLDSTELGPIHKHVVKAKIFMHLDLDPIDINFGSRLRTMNRSSTKEDAWDRVLEANGKVYRPY